jgi:hypothetical protein
MERGEALSWLRVGDLSMRDSLNSAYLILSEPARTLLKCIAMLPFSYDLGSVFRGEDELVEELVEAGMLRRDDHAHGYRLQPLVRAFAIDAEAPPRFDASAHVLWPGTDIERQLLAPDGVSRAS